MRPGCFAPTEQVAIICPKSARGSLAVPAVCRRLRPGRESHQPGHPGGGGAHGAYAWGVMDRLLEDGRIKIEGLTAWQFLLYLRDLGRQIAAQWLDESFESIGQRSTVDLRAEFL